LFIRFPEEQKEHQAFFLVDPSNNLIEFKHYSHPESMY
jgi:extradiol dioxygenase family protein